MPGESPTKLQAQAYRFGVRRLESAVSSGDPLLRGDPVRRRLNISLIVSFIVAALILGGFAVYGFIRPEPKIGNAAVVIDSDTGGVYVSRAGRLYPAMNLSSALLAAGRGQSGSNAPSVATVDSAAIGREPRGPLLGIPGAPNVLPTASHLVAPRWTVCDRTTTDPALPPGSAPKVRTTAVVGEPEPLAGALGTTFAMIVTPDGGGSTYLVWNGVRSKIDLTSDTIRLAFSLGTDVTARPISPALLDVIPEQPDLLVPAIDTSGAQPSYATTLGVQVGDVFALERADHTRAIYVALPDGVQQINPLVGDLIRDEFDEVKAIPLVAPRLLRQSPRSAHPIDLTRYPATRPVILGYQQSPVACVSRTGTSATAQVFGLDAVPVPASAKPVTVTEPGGLTVDEVYVHPGRGAVFAASTSAQQPGAGRPLYVVTDEGVAYPIVDRTALTDLGLAAHVRATAPELIALLPKGPTLDPAQAVHFYPQTDVSAGSLPAPSSSAGGPQG